MTDLDVIAEELSGLGEKVRGLEGRMADIEKVNARLEDAALNTSRAMQEISRHWDAVYEAMRRAETVDSETSSERDRAACGSQGRRGAGARGCRPATPRRRLSRGDSSGLGGECARLTWPDQGAENPVTGVNLDEGGGMAWSLRGTYFETCSCEVVCPCTASLALAPTTTAAR